MRGNCLWARLAALLALCSWWDVWAKYAGFELVDDSTPIVKQRDESEEQSARPDAIDNSDLARDGWRTSPLLRSNLQEGTDYKIVSESTWNLLHHWYGGGPAFVRHWLDGPHPYVEVYAMQLIIKRHPSQKEENLFISRKVSPGCAVISVSPVGKGANILQSCDRRKSLNSRRRLASLWV